jgi:hypothetical protein
MAIRLLLPEHDVSVYIYFPLPLVWSPEGPVLDEEVDPECGAQSLDGPTFDQPVTVYVPPQLGYVTLVFASKLSINGNVVIGVEQLGGGGEL